MVADLESALAHVGHVAVGAGNAGARVHALIPHLELGMACLDQPSAGIGMIPFLDLLLVFHGDDVFDFQSLGPWKGEALVRRLEVISHGHWPQTNERISWRVAIVLTS